MLDQWSLVVQVDVVIVIGILAIQILNCRTSFIHIDFIVQSDLQEYESSMCVVLLSG